MRVMPEVMNTIRRQHGGNTSGLERSLQRLSSGMRINQSSDDAAGLSIASRLLSRSRGSDQASRNIQDGISLARTAEGGLAGLQDMAQRLRELAVMASNDTLTDGERAAIQDEATQVRLQMQAVVTDTTFNGIQVLRGRASSIDSMAPEVDTFSRGRVETLTVNPDVRIETSKTEIAPSRSVIAGNYQSFWNRESLPGWSADDSKIETKSSRTGNLYEFPSTGGVATLTSDQTYTRKTTAVIGGITCTLQNYRRDPLGYDVYDGIYVSRNGSVPQNATEAIFAKVPSTFLSFSFSNSGGQIAIADENILQVASFNPGSLSPFSPAPASIGALTLINQDGDLLDVPQQYVLPQKAEWYQRADGARSIVVEKRNHDGTVTTVPYDASKTNGWSIAADRSTISLHGAAVVDSNDVLTVRYQADDGQVTDLDGNLDIRPSEKPEIYGLGTASSSVRLTRTGLGEIPYDTTNTNGYNYDPVTNTFTVYGDARPSGAQDVILTYQTDRSGGSAVNSNQDGILDFGLSGIPDNWNLNTPGAAQAIRVTVGGTAVAHDATGTNGFSLAGNTIRLHGSARPTATQSVEVDYWQDLTTANQDGEMAIAVSMPDPYGITPGATGPRSMRVYVDGTEIAPDPVNGYEYDAAQSKLVLRGTSLPDVHQSITLKVVLDRDWTAGAHNVQLMQPAAIYSAPQEGSVQVLKSGTPLVQRDPDGFTLDAAAPATVSLRGDSRPDAVGTTYTFRYVTTEDNTFALTPGPEFPVVTACPETYMPTNRGVVVDEASLQVTVNGTSVPADAVNGYTVSKIDGPIIDGVQSYKDYRITLNGTSRLSGTGHTATVEYDYTNFRYTTMRLNIQTGASATDTYALTIDPADLEAIGLDALCLDDADEARKAIAQIDTTIEILARMRGQVGAQINRMTSMEASALESGMQATSARSRIIDLDFGKGVVEMTAFQIKQQAASAVMSQSRQLNSSRIQQLLAA